MARSERYSLCVHDRKKNQFLYVDSLGNPLPKELGKAIKENFPDAKIFDAKVDQQEDADICGFYVWKNAKKIMQLVKKNVSFENIIGRKDKHFKTFKEGKIKKIRCEADDVLGLKSKGAAECYGVVAKNDDHSHDDSKYKEDTALIKKLIKKGDKNNYNSTEFNDEQVIQRIQKGSNYTEDFSIISDGDEEDMQVIERIKQRNRNVKTNNTNPRNFRQRNNLRQQFLRQRNRIIDSGANVVGALDNLMPLNLQRMCNSACNFLWTCGCLITKGIAYGLKRDQSNKTAYQSSIKDVSSKAQEVLRSPFPKVKCPRLNMKITKVSESEIIENYEREVRPQF